MSRLPIPHIINTIKTKLGFDRTMTAPGDDIVDAVNKQSRQIGTLVAAEAKTFKDGIEVTLPNVSDTNRTFAVAGITANHSLVQEGYAYLSDPSAATGDLQLVTAAGTVTVSGTLSRTTNIIASFVIKQQSATGTAAN